MLLAHAQVADLAARAAVVAGAAVSRRALEIDANHPCTLHACVLTYRACAFAGGARGAARTAVAASTAVRSARHEVHADAVALGLRAAAGITAVAGVVASVARVTGVIARVTGVIARVSGVIARVTGVVAGVAAVLDGGIAAVGAAPRVDRRIERRCVEEQRRICLLYTSPSPRD